jgi:VanZ family protein
VLAAPGLGSARSALRAAWPGAFSLVVEGGLAAALLVTIVVALRRIRTDRVRRYALLVIALAIASAYSAATGSRDPAIRAVEHVHFLSFGAIAWLFFRVWRHRPDASGLAAPALAALIAGVGDEAFQWFLPARVGEIADVALNAVAIGCGLIVGAALAPPAAPRGAWIRGSWRLVGGLLAAAVLAVAAFAHLVHLGHRLEGPGGTAFLSRYTAPELDALASNRAAAWRTAPPLVRPPRFSREDQYATEGLQHIQARNTAWDLGDARAAWHENAILERFFAPVLDTPSYVSRTGHRWSAPHRADADARVQTAGGAGRFESAAFPYRLVTWPPLALWLSATALALAMVAVAWRLDARAAATVV